MNQGASSSPYAHLFSILENPDIKEADMTELTILDHIVMFGALACYQERQEYGQRLVHLLNADEARSNLIELVQKDEPAINSFERFLEALSERLKAVSLYEPADKNDTTMTMVFVNQISIATEVIRCIVDGLNNHDLSFLACQNQLYANLSFISYVLERLNLGYELTSHQRNLTSLFLRPFQQVSEKMIGLELNHEQRVQAIALLKTSKKILGEYFEKVKIPLFAKQNDGFFENLVAIAEQELGAASLSAQSNTGASTQEVGVSSLAQNTAKASPSEAVIESKYDSTLEAIDSMKTTLGHLKSQGKDLLSKAKALEEKWSSSKNQKSKTKRKSAVKSSSKALMLLRQELKKENQIAVELWQNIEQMICGVIDEKIEDAVILGEFSNGLAKLIRGLQSVFVSFQRSEHLLNSLHKELKGSFGWHLIIPSHQERVRIETLLCQLQGEWERAYREEEKTRASSTISQDAEVAEILESPASELEKYKRTASRLIESLQEEIETLKANKTKLEKKSSRIYKKYTASVSESLTTHAELKETKTLLEERKSKIESLTRINQQLITIVGKLKYDLSDLAEQLRLKKEKKSIDKNTQVDLVPTSSGAQHLIEEMEELRSRLNRQIKELTRELNKKSNRLEKKSKVIEGLEQHVEELKAQLDSRDAVHRQSTKDVHEELKKAKACANDYQNQLTQLKRQLNRFAHSSEGSKARLVKDVGQTLEGYDKRIDALSDMLQRLTLASKTSKKAKNQALKARNLELQSIRDKLQQKLTKQECHIKHLANETRNLHHELANVQATNEALVRKAQEQEAQIRIALNERHKLVRRIEAFSHEEMAYRRALNDANKNAGATYELTQRYESMIRFYQEREARRWVFHQQELDYVVPGVFIEIPDDIRSIMDEIEKHGAQCYVFGGYVRDKILGYPSRDVDLVANFTPTQMAQFQRRWAELYGIQFVKCPYIPDLYTLYRDGMPSVDLVLVPELDLKAYSDRMDMNANTFLLTKRGRLLDPNNHYHQVIKIELCFHCTEDKVASDPVRILRALKLWSKFEVFPSEHDKAIIERQIERLGMLPLTVYLKHFLSAMKSNPTHFFTIINEMEPVVQHVLFRGLLDDVDEAHKVQIQEKLTQIAHLSATKQSFYPNFFKCLADAAGQRLQSQTEVHNFIADCLSPWSSDKDFLRVCLANVKGWSRGGLARSSKEASFEAEFPVLVKRQDPLLYAYDVQIGAPSEVEESKQRRSKRLGG